MNCGYLSSFFRLQAIYYCSIASATLFVHDTDVVSSRSIEQSRTDGSGVSASVQEYCVAETFQARCSHGDVIAMTTALFGRMNVGRCITSDAFQLQKLQPDSLGCAVDVLEYFDRTCSGRSACDVVIPNPDLLRFRPCSAQLVVYLEASYSCVSVVDEDRSCSLTAAVGSEIFISNTVDGQRKDHAVDILRCGSRTNPWTVEVQSGQTINVSLMDFGPHQQQQQQRPTTDDVTKNNVDKDDRQHDTCDVSYGYILDKSSNAQTNRNNMTICNSFGRHRDIFVYQSKDSRIEVVLSLARTDLSNGQRKFLLGFEAVGCSNLVPPADAWLRRVENEATVGCYTTRQRWHLRCQGGRWTGILGQCTEMEVRADSNMESQVVADLTNDTFVASLSLVAISFIGVAVCLIIIFIGLGCYRRYKDKKRPRTTVDRFTPVTHTRQYIDKNIVSGSHNNEDTGFILNGGRHHQ